LDKWDQLDQDKKGYYVGYVIGRYGTDALICGGCVRAVQLYRNIKRSNIILTLDRALASPESIVQASEEFFTARANYKKKCFIELDQQTKLVPGAKNFKPQSGKSELPITIEELEQLTKPLIGEGVPMRFSLGEAGYQEIVQYTKVIGEYVTPKEVRAPTSFAVIHYNKNEGYHVVPIDPESYRALKFIQEK
jgi:hypothetical protein